MYKLDLDSKWNLTLEGKLVKASQIGKPIIFIVDYRTEISQKMLDDEIQSLIVLGSLPKEKVPNAYLEGKCINVEVNTLPEVNFFISSHHPMITYIPVQFYKVD